MRIFWRLSVCLLIIITSFHANANCDQLLNDFETSTFGISINRDVEGNVSSVFMVGEADFLVAKSSLVRKAKKTAFMRAKAEFSRFMKEDFSASDLQSELTNEISTTDQDGNTTGNAEEIASLLEFMGSNTETVLSGVVVLGECVDSEEKNVLVIAGWKPQMSEVATNVKQSIQKEVARSKTNNANTKVENKIVTSKSEESVENKDVGVSSVSIEVEGFGENLKVATNEAIRNALAQVLGEKYSSSQLNKDFTATAELTNTNNETTGDALEINTNYEVQSSEVKGIVRSYKYLLKEELVDRFRVILLVDIPKYKSSLNSSANTLIVLKPVVEESSGISLDESNKISSVLQNTLESLINRSDKLEVLDRAFLKERSLELSTISSENSSISELAREGNLAGADYMLIVQFNELSLDVENRQVGKNIITRHNYDGFADYKVIEIATSNIVTAETENVSKLKFKSENSGEKLGKKIGQLIAKKIISQFQGNDQVLQNSLTIEKQDINEAHEAAKENMIEFKEKTKNVW